MIIAVIAASLLISAIGAYGFFVERGRLRIVRQTIRSPRIPPSFDGATIVQFSDTHLSSAYSLKRLGKLVEAVNSQHPDLVVFTGDLHDARRSDNIAKYDPSPLLARIQAHLGKFAVYGNHDFGYERKLRSSGAFLNRGGFSVLINSTQRIEHTDGDYITISGLDDYVLGKPNAAKTIARLEDDRFHVLLVHEPDLADRLIRYPIDLQLSGHSHGGQVRLPLLGSLVRTKLGSKYVGGMYRIGGGHRVKRPYRLYVNRGIGTTRIPIRLFCAPELTVFTLRRE